jgi:hypothetical protein
MSAKLSRVCLIALFSAAASFGQGERATVTGTVTDTSGAIVVGAPVSMRNIATNIGTETATNAARIYYLTSLNPAKCELRRPVVWEGADWRQPEKYSTCVTIHVLIIRRFL